METFSTKSIFLSNLITITAFILGSWIFFNFNLYGGIGYLILCVGSIIISLKYRCVACCYYGKLCSSGFGLLAAKLFSKEDPTEFQNKKKFTITAIISFSVSFLPIIGGIISLILQFSLVQLMLLIIYTIIAILPNFLIRKNVCQHCKQGELGCPAYNKMTQKN